MKYIYIIILILLIASTIIGYFVIRKENCQKINKMTKIEIKNYLTVDEINILVTRVFELGECKKKEAIPELQLLINDQRISHILKFKGIRLGKIATRAIKKIENL